MAELEANQYFDAAKDCFDYILNALAKTNDELCIKLSEETRTSVDNTFSLIATSPSARSPFNILEAVGDIQISTQLPRLYHDVGTMASMKHMSILMSCESFTTLHDTTIQAALIRKDPKIADPETCPQMYWYSFGFDEGQERRVFVEWKGYAIQKRHKPGTSEFEEVGKALFRRVKELTVMLKHGPKPTNFPVLQCLGTFHRPDKERFGIVYDFPPDTATSVRLQKLLRIGRIQKIYPDLAQKFDLAKILVAALYNYHASGWLHKNISSSNILLFMKEDGRWDTLDLAQPFVIGFHHSRRDNPNEYAEGPEILASQKEYQHPDYRRGQKRFRKIYDYYSLGLVLLEIGTWSSLSNIYGKRQTLTPEELKDEYLKWCDNDLKKTMGPIYHSVTKECLLFSHDENSHDDDSRSQIDFQSEVISKLDAYNV